VHRFVEFDTVRIVVLHGSAEDHLAASGGVRLPQVGDTGTIVHLVPTFEPDNPATRYLVEDVAPDGTTVWLAEFGRDELEYIPRTV
jgi:hypothetical protein